MLTTPTRLSAAGAPENRHTTVNQMEKSRHILLIDDDEIFVFLTRKMLQGTGMVERITACRKAAEALEFLHRHISSADQPDIIFLDLNMPAMNGWQFLENYQYYLRQAKTRPRLYVVSSSITEDERARALQTPGVDGYLSKPLHIQGIREMLRKATSEKKIN